MDGPDLPRDRPPLPLKGDMMKRKTPITKWAKHVHHDILIEPLTEPITKRRNYIRKYKDPSEIPLRLRLLKEIRWKLPTKLTKAWEAYNKARKLCYKTREAYDKAQERYHKMWEAKAGEAFEKARQAYDKAGEVSSNAWEAYIGAYEDSLPQIEALHKKECPNCPWDGKTIFPDTKR